MERRDTLHARQRCCFWRLSRSDAGCPDSDRRGLMKAIGRVGWDRVALVVGEDLARVQVGHRGVAWLLRFVCTS